MYSQAPSGSWRGPVRYDPHLDRYLLLQKGTSQLWSIDPVTWAATPVAATGTPFTVPDTDGEQSLHGRFALIPRFKVLIVVPSARQNAYFMRTS